MLEVSIVGASGYAGGELLRLLLFHPHVSVKQVTSERFAGKPVTRVHPNLRGMTELRFVGMSDLMACDLLFLCLPHGEAAAGWDLFSGLAPRIVDLSADFRLQDSERYRSFYGGSHPRPELLKDFVYGIPELYRARIREAERVSCAGCNATVAILALFPLYDAGIALPDRTVVEVKVGSSEAGNKPGESGHHPERSGCLRSFSPTGHRHTAEIEQALSVREPVRVHFSATAVDMVRGALATCHVFPAEPIDLPMLWQCYRRSYGSEPFVRIVKERQGNYRYPEPKLLAGTNYCDLGFATDPLSDRLVVVAAIDNLMKGAAGQAVQNMNLMCGFEERTALTFPGLNPV